MMTNKTAGDEEFGLNAPSPPSGTADANKNTTEGDDDDKSPRPACNSAVGKASQYRAAGARGDNRG